MPQVERITRSITIDSTCPPARPAFATCQVRPPLAVLITPDPTAPAWITTRRHQWSGSALESEERAAQQRRQGEGMANFAYSILFVSDMDKSIHFYRDLVGLRLKMQSPEWSEFDTGSCTLALHKAAAGAVAQVQQGQIPAGHMHCGFLVQDVDAFAELMEREGVTQMEPVRMQEFGARMGVWRDPDGVPVSVMAFVH
jgi:lactoylglutathione lyase